VKKYHYNADEYSFVSFLMSLYNCNDLTQLHEKLPDNIKYNEVFDIDSDNKTWFHKKFYEVINSGTSEFEKEYVRFVREQIQPHFAGKIICQTNPTFRVHIPGNVAVGSYSSRPTGFHRDSDPGYNHPIEEVNIFVPLTKAFGTNTIWAETESGKEDYKPMDGKPGEFYIWKGSKLTHGNKENATGCTRVSFDFRVMLEKDYLSGVESFKSSRDTNKKFVLGQYYRDPWENN
tara:strand:- start:4677 stop:5372 length:696 start_codon:yes stop_codon:yes gene_type:complete